MNADRKAGDERPIVFAEHQGAWESWLLENHGQSPGVWLRIARKGAGIMSVSYSEALEVALCYGWIDGQKRAHDPHSWLQKFTRRAARSLWSQINRDKAMALIDAGRMKDAGYQEIERARADGRWAAAYEPASKATVPDDFQRALDGNAEARAFFLTLDAQNRYAILFRIQTAKKAETRVKRMQQFIEMLANRDKIRK
jgi:uncharacterized protein YdeI (YjbR/CyaY-like superfamily)